MAVQLLWACSYLNAQDFSSSQDSSRSNNPEPVVITQDGYDPSQGDPSYKPLSERSFKERLKYGGSAGPFSFSRNFTAIGLSPMLGYMLSEKTIVGVGFSYIFLREKDLFTNTKIKDDILGYRAFIRQDLAFTQKINFPLFLTGEIEQYQGVQSKAKARPAFMAGLGYGMAGGYGISVMYDFNFRENLSYNQIPIVLRVTGFFN